jgi:Cysteine-rich secretory protein family
MKPIFSIYLLLLSSVTLFAQSPSPAEQKIFNLLNQERTIEHLPALKWNGQAAVAARAHSRLLARHGEMSHQFEKEDPVPQRVAATGLRFTDSAENIAVADAPEEVHMALMLSPGHKANIMNARYNSVGIGVFEDKGRLWVTQDFAWATAVYNDIGFGTALISTFNRAREQKGIKPIDAHLDTHLSTLACSAKGDVQNIAAGINGTAGRVFLFTLSEPTQMPEQLSDHLFSKTQHRVNVGVCFSPDQQHGYANFWVVTVFPA